jgi:hypothetical protein
MLKERSGFKEDTDGATTRAEVGLNVKLYTFVGSELFKDSKRTLSASRGVCVLMARSTRRIGPLFAYLA